MASAGLPKVTLELHAKDGHVVRIRSISQEAEKASSEVLFVTRGVPTKSSVEQIPEAIGLPFDAEFFKLLTSEATMHSLVTQFSEKIFRFRSPKAIEQMSSIRLRLLQDLQTSLRELPRRGVGKILRGASDAWQAEKLSQAEEPQAPAERARKRLCLTWPGDVGQAEEMACQIRSLAEEEGLKVMVQVCEADEPLQGPCLALQLPADLRKKWLRKRRLWRYDRMLKPTKPGVTTRVTTRIQRTQRSFAEL